VSFLSIDQKASVIAALCEGVSIRATERLTGIHRDTIMRLGVKVGTGCSRVHASLMRDLNIGRIEMDEVWSFVGKKRNKVKETDNTDLVGDQYIFMAMDATGKAIISWLVGKRDTWHAKAFVDDVRHRVIGAPEISTDGFQPYASMIKWAFEGQAAHGIIDKQMVVVAGGPDSGKYYARNTVSKIERITISGSPQNISTSFIERQNLSLRMSSRRMTRMTNGFSKKFDNHCAAISLYATHYNFCRVHEALRTTPAMHLQITDHVWTISELIQAAISGVTTPTKEAIPKGFRVIDGGKK
jgi:IS1 family transposase